MKKYLAELIGTFLLSFAVIVGLSGVALPTAVLAALALGLAVYVFGDVSGAHMNPAITIAFLSAGKIKTKQAVFYLIAQFVAALIAIYLGKWLFSYRIALPIHETLKVGFAEMLGAFILALGVSAVAYERVKPAAAGLLVGASLLLGILLASPFANGLLNPAVALAVGSFSIAYTIGPIIGAIAGVWLFKTIAGPTEIQYK